MKVKQSMSDEIRKAIALKAYYIWEAEGRPEGHGDKHWAMAEAEVLGEKAAKQAPKKAVVKEPMAAATGETAAVAKTPKKAPAKKAAPAAKASSAKKSADGAAKPAVKKAAKPKAGKDERA